MTKKDDFDLQDFLPYLLNQAAEESSLSFQNIYKARYGMLRTEWRVLFHLGIYGRMSAKEICERSKMHKTKISRAVARLEERRFLTRERDAGDRRLEALELTAAGRAAYIELRGVAMDYDAKLAEAFSPDDVAVLRKLLHHLAKL
ncbi:MarR family winged helix-turn-helix transcriptional regulator [Lentibacter sp. XHP0401]|jgi:DNA-binding MarR family transcriptional regulator|uniref:MarR family winged helix-turn-helix transcriptional regulator n=1 Tax=Lentibacter sp. XHP0401 TaxID=2984334 RepID=UPI0021E78320|nr:MarR family transcriptional regulator [Lentibacter sp. XHP0401]MCV2894021.1 MarR family winged helix-turn-helix transcriptional regulator [Lentibacter sp. XHP0401]